MGPRAPCERLPPHPPPHPPPPPPSSPSPSLSSHNRRVPPLTRPLGLVRIVAAVLLALAVVGVDGAFRDTTSLFDDSRHVATLATVNYSTLIHHEPRATTTWLVLYYVPWLPPCRRFARELEAVAAAVATGDNDNGDDDPASATTIRIGAVDCGRPSNRQICQDEGIATYPTLELVPSTTTTTTVTTTMPSSRLARRFPRMGQWTRGSVLKWLDDHLDAAHMVSRSNNNNNNHPEAAPARPHRRRRRRRLPIEVPVDAANVAPATTTRSAIDTEKPTTTEANALPPLSVKYARLQDAGVAAMFSLEQSLFQGGPGPEDTVRLAGARYDAARAWVRALAGAFPLAANRAVFHELEVAMSARAQWPRDDWDELLRDWKRGTRDRTFPRALLVFDEAAAWAQCNTYNCGLWTLLHSLTAGVGVGVGAGDESDGDGDDAGITVRPSAIAGAIQGFVGHFFGCARCVRGFLDDATHGPESLARLDQNDDPEGNHALVLWLWRLHNGISLATSKEPWPSVRECPTCYPESETTTATTPPVPDDRELARFLARAYGHDEREAWRMTYVHHGLGAVLWDVVLALPPLALLGAITGAVVLFLQHRRHRRERKFA